MGMEQMTAAPTVAAQQCGPGVAGLVETADDIERAVRDDEGPYRFDWRDKKHRVVLDATAKLREAASLIQSQAARIAELEAGLERAVEIAQEYVPHLPPDGPSSAEHQVAYDTAGFLYRDLFRHARALLNGERKG